MRCNHASEAKKSQTGCLFLLLKPRCSPDFSIIFRSLHEILWGKKKVYEWLTDVPLQHSLQLWFYMSLYLPNLLLILKVPRHNSSILNFHGSTSTFNAAWSSSDHSPGYCLFGKCFGTVQIPKTEGKCEALLLIKLSNNYPALMVLSNSLKIFFMCLYLMLAWLALSCLLARDIQLVP